MATLNYRHRFLVQAPLEMVARFHAQSDSMRAIAPPPIVVQMHTAPTELAEGDEMVFSLWFGPLPVRWRARIEDVTPAGFIDRQLAGPFETWVHRHSFLPIDETTTEIRDEIELTLQRNPFWSMVGMAMRINLPFLFVYRAWRTQRLLTAGRQPAE